MIATAQAQEYPQRGPLEITVLFPAGSSADVTARMLADGMSRNLGQRVLVVNRPGAGGAIDYHAFDAVARVLVESPVVAVRADSRWKTLNELVTEARAKPQQISVGHSG